MRPLNEEKITQVYEYIQEIQFKERRSPTLREICAACDVSSTSWASQILTILEERSLIEIRIQGNRRVISIPGNLDSGSAIKTSILGDCPCGEPMFAAENILATVALPVEIFGKDEHFILRAKGRSMIKRGIHDGDLMVVRVQSTAEIGDVVIARVNQEEATAKVLARSRGKFYLKPANDEVDSDGEPMYKDIHPKGEWDILGVVDHVIHSTKKEV